MKSIRVILADDHENLRHRVAKMLAPEFDVVNMVSNSIELLEAEAKHTPDIVILDITMPGLSGFDAARLLLEANPEAKIVFLTMHNDQAFVEEALDIGALGYVIKSHLVSDLVLAIKAANQGRVFVSPSMLPEKSN